MIGLRKKISELEASFLSPLQLRASSELSRPCPSNEQEALRMARQAQEAAEARCRELEAAAAEARGGGGSSQREPKEQAAEKRFRVYRA